VQSRGLLSQGANNSSITDRDEYKAAEEKVQYPVPQTRFGEGVRKVLARHDGSVNRPFMVEEALLQPFEP